MTTDGLALIILDELRDMPDAGKTRRKLLENAGEVSEILNGDSKRPADPIAFLRGIFQGPDHTLEFATKILDGEENLGQRAYVNARKSFEEALSIAKNESLILPGSEDWLRYIAMTEGLLGDLNMEIGDKACAIRNYSDAIGATEAIGTMKNGNKASVAALEIDPMVLLLDKLGEAYLSGSDPDAPKAIDTYTKKLNIVKRSININDRNMDFRKYEYKAYISLSDASQKNGKLSDAAGYMNMAADTAEKAARMRSPNADVASDLIDIYKKSADIEVASCHPERALFYANKLKQLIDRREVDDPGRQNRKSLITIAEGLGQLAEADLAGGDPAAARAASDRAVEFARMIADLQPDQENRNRQLLLLEMRAKVERRQLQPVAARRDVAEALKIARTLQDEFRGTVDLTDDIVRLQKAGDRQDRTDRKACRASG